MCQSGDANQPLEQTGASDIKVTTVGIDLAKNVFQLHGVNEYGKTVVTFHYIESISFSAFMFDDNYLGRLTTTISSFHQYSY